MLPKIACDPGALPFYRLVMRNVTTNFIKSILKGVLWHVDSRCPINQPASPLNGISLLAPF